MVSGFLSAGIIDGARCWKDGREDHRVGGLLGSNIVLAICTFVNPSGLLHVVLQLLF